ncbi:hypothetical protein ABGV42_01260 [Paenibacillus pabuli]|uniref:hypothetical protein n=1 Tax=Paenibacillus pabuli TaxID=1472 RepID=UPI003242FD64
MAEYQERHGSIYFWDTDSDRPIHIIESPAILFDTDGIYRLKLGERADLDSYYARKVAEAEEKGHSDLVATWALLDLPKDAELLNRLLKDTTYLETYLKKHLEK